MGDTLAHLRNTTVEDVMRAPATFDDLPNPVYRGTAPKNMVRIVEGADDLRHPNAGNRSGGVARRRSTPASEVGIIVIDSDARTPKQIELMASLHMQLSELDAETAEAAVAYTTRMTLNRKWTSGRDGNASAWIGRMIAKVRELKSANIAAQATTTKGPWAEWRELASKLVEFGGHTGARFAVATEAGSDNDLAFWWIVPGRDGNEGKFFLRQVIGGQGPVRVRMPVAGMIAVARKIAADPKGAMLRYGQEIGSCGHCGRELTNKVSRDFGIGPKCRKDKGW
jgi:hypothetical protein